jgi:hypothetical protein
MGGNALPVDRGVEDVRNLRRDVDERLKQLYHALKGNQRLAIACAKEIDTMRGEVEGWAERFKDVDDEKPATLDM